MLAAVIGAVAKKALELGCTLVKKKLEMWKEVEGDVVDIKADLEMIAAAEEELILGKGDPSKLKIQSMEEMLGLAQEIEDSLDGILRDAKSPTLHRVKKVGSHMGNPPFEKEVKRFKKRLKAAKKRALDFGVNVSQPATMARLDDYTSGRPSIEKQEPIGISKPKEDILELLGDIKGQKEQLTVICIVGFGGSGRSTLADAVYQDVMRRGPSSCSKIDAREHKDDTKGLREAIETVLRQESERYLIVLDNIEAQQWQSISSTFNENKSGVIIATTTVRSVAEKVCSSHGDGHVYNMIALEEGDSVKLLEHILKHKNLSMFEGSLDSIAKQCDGHPLALYSMAQYLLGVEQEFTRQDFCDFWDSLCDEMKKHPAEFRDLEQILMNTYCRLPGFPRNERACLLYICAFPFDHSIRRNRLIRRWLAEGYSQKEANEIFKELVNHNIFRTTGSSKSIKAGKTCKAHGIIHGFMMHKSKSTRFMESADSSERRNYRHLYWNDGVCQQHSSQYINRDKESSNQKFHAHSLTICGKAGKRVIGDLPNCKVLRVLDLEECEDLESRDIENIDKLWHLKYLSLGPNIDKLPEEKICMLHCLQTLDLRNTKIDTIPVVVIKLPHLAHLLGKFKLDKMESSEVDKFSKKESNLETLAGFVTEGNPGFPMLMVHMKYLNKVKIWCDSTSKDSEGFNALLEAVKKFLKAGLPKSALGGDHSLSLYLGLGDSSKEILRSLWDDEEILIGYLSSLKLDGALSGLTRFATLLCGLKELYLSSTNGLTIDELSGLHKIKFLKYLKLVNVDLAGFEISSEHFCKLQRLCLVQCLNLPTIGAGALPDLDSLWILNKDLDGLSDININQHKHLEEVALDYNVKQATKISWDEAAKKHPKRPKVLFFRFVSSNGKGSYVATERSDKAVKSNSFVDQLQASNTYRHPPASTTHYDMMEIDVASSSRVMT